MLFKIEFLTSVSACEGEDAQTTLNCWTSALPPPNRATVRRTPYRATQPFVQQCAPDRTEIYVNGMSSSSHSRLRFGQAEASSSRTSNGKQPAVEEDHSDEEALLTNDALDRDLPEQYAWTRPDKTDKARILTREHTISFKRKPKASTSSIGFSRCPYQLWLSSDSALPPSCIQASCSLDVDRQFSAILSYKTYRCQLILGYGSPTHSHMPLT
jgi:hypothetical protein